VAYRLGLSIVSESWETPLKQDALRDRDRAFLVFAV
jgi:hypothetical protein